MSTAVDTAFEELVSAQSADPLHLVCAACWPRSTPLGVAVAVCGHQTTGPEEIPKGHHRCATCVALENTTPLPCGHP